MGFQNRRQKSKFSEKVVGRRLGCHGAGSLLGSEGMLTLPIMQETCGLMNQADPFGL